MSYNTVMVALAARGDEKVVIEEAVKLAKSSSAALVAVHVNDPHAGEMSMMMDSAGPRLDEEDIRQRFREYGFLDEAEEIEVRIITGGNISTLLAEQTEEVDMLVLGHRRMSTFKSNLMDSVDEGIVNHAKCPVLVVPK
ncbi:MAG: universal stress protein [Candidatus Marinimicrobia bacterium]|jgi:nucleotide-binding universal stress UspA family protein|nr:universal stress protein [Candidatus Neomarinimicrobiota bacterium]MDP6789882.1 universal stress protein [Candidatus Neomarinimicrobiota bacterium]MDP7071476.1 universal stress protein [Candidatus Neomarinimicrobiota bacterium]|tara:strand:+ start:42 stop:458 length:417 start_codon:yes stop_codon:yes gene_type:complete